MKKFITCFLLSAILIFSSACTTSRENYTQSTTTDNFSAETISSVESETSNNATTFENNTTNFPQEQALFEAAKFDSVSEYYTSAQRNSMPDCYVLKNKPENAEIADVTFRENSYVSVHYHIPLAEKYENEELSEYSIERMTTITCQHKLAEDGEESFKINILDKLDTNGYVKTEINGRDYYYQPEHDPLYNRDIIIGYEVAFLQDGERIFLHLPPLDTFENMAQYLEVVKAEA